PAPPEFWRRTCASPLSSQSMPSTDGASARLCCPLPALSPYPSDAGAALCGTTACSEAVRSPETPVRLQGQNGPPSRRRSHRWAEEALSEDEEGEPRGPGGLVLC